MDITNLINNNIVEIVKDGSYICVSLPKDDCEKIQAMTKNFDTHLTILMRFYEEECIVSAYPWPTQNLEPLPDKIKSHERSSLLNSIKVFEVFADFDLVRYLEDKKPSKDPLDYSLDASDEDDYYKDKNSHWERRLFNEPCVATAFFKIKYSEGKSFRNCFESIRSVLIGNCLTKRAA